MMSWVYIHDVMSKSKQITLRNVPDELAGKLKALAEKNGTSVNSTVLLLLQNALGEDPRRRRLKERYATWAEEDFDEFQRTLDSQRVIDASLWT